MEDAPTARGDAADEVLCTTTENHELPANKAAFFRPTRSRFTSRLNLDAKRRQVDGQCALEALSISFLGSRGGECQRRTGCMRQHLLRALPKFSARISSLEFLGTHPLFLFAFPMSLLLSHFWFWFPPFSLWFFVPLSIYNSFSLSILRKCCNTPFLAFSAAGLAWRNPSPPFSLEQDKISPNDGWQADKKRRRKNYTEKYAAILLNAFNSLIL